MTSALSSNEPLSTYLRIAQISHFPPWGQHWTAADYKKKSTELSVLFLCVISGFLSSQDASIQVLSAFAGLTTVFGMGTGGSPQLSPLNYLFSRYFYPDNRIEKCLLFLTFLLF